MGDKSWFFRRLANVFHIIQETNISADYFSIILSIGEPGHFLNLHNYSEADREIITEMVRRGVKAFATYSEYINAQIYNYNRSVVKQSKGVTVKAKYFFDDTNAVSVKRLDEIANEIRSLQSPIDYTRLRGLMY